MGFERAKLSSQFRPENKADEYNKDNNNDGGDKALLIHSAGKEKAKSMLLEPPNNRIGRERLGK